MSPAGEMMAKSPAHYWVGDFFGVPGMGDSLLEEQPNPAIHSEGGIQPQPGQAGIGCVVAKKDEPPYTERYVR